MKKIIVFTGCVALLYFLRFPAVLCTALAQDGSQQAPSAAELTKCVMEKASVQETYPCFEALAKAYFQDNRYADFVGLLSSLKDKKKSLAPYADYYIAISRYRQLKFLEQAQLWNDYFANGNTYRDELTSHAQAAIEATLVNDPVHVSAQLMLWEFHKGQQDAFVDQAYASLSASAIAYAKDPQDLPLVKQIAQDLAAGGERAKSKEVYKLYVDKVMASATSDDNLAKTAAAFFSEGNVDLASTVYDKYIERLEASGAPKEKMVPALSEIAGKFVYSSEGSPAALRAVGAPLGGSSDPAYAEKIFKKLEIIGGKESFDEGFIYLRALNLEKIKDYKGAYDVYADLISRYPATLRLGEAVFKMGVMQVYAFRNIDKGREYFQQLAQKEAVSPQVIASLYQLGLLSQWSGDATRAKDCYNQLIERSAGNFPQTRALADKRFAEIDGQKDIEYNLKTFLDASLKNDSPAFNPSKADVNLAPASAKQNDAVTVTASAYAEESGCSQVSLNYLWSGDLGDAVPAGDQAEFSTHYTSSGTDVVNLVVMSPSGILDRSFAFLDLQ